MTDPDPASGPALPGFPAPSMLDLEDLLAEIRTRAQGASLFQTRLASLLDAVVAMSSELDLKVVLSHVVESACALLDARYGAVGVVDPAGGHLVEFVQCGMPAEVVARLDHPPRGEGVLGLLLDDPVPQRIADLSAHPCAVGFPPGHPPMTSFIGVPIRVRGIVFGNLYLTEKSGGRRFTGDDESVLVALAAAAGIAVENAQLYRRARRAEAWSKAVGELTQTLLEGRNERSTLARTVKHARELGEAELAALLVPDPDGGLVVQAVDAVGKGLGLRGRVLTDHRWRLLMASRTPVMLRVEEGDVGGGELSDQVRTPADLDGPATTAVVPMAVGEVEVGLILLSWGVDAPVDVGETMDLLTGFADRMALAIEAARAQRHRSQAVLLEDRDRIARDMHDHVIQRLFAAGLTLQAVSRHAEGKVADRVEFVVDELDLAVKDIRSAIFELHHGFPQGGLGPELESVVEKATVAFGFVPDVAFEGRLSDISDDLVPDVVAVVREALSNVARHARATDARVRVVNTGDDLVVTVVDNGVGLRQDADRSGLANLAGRAARHGGTFSAMSTQPSGTLLRWSVPLGIDAEARAGGVVPDAAAE
ncbi:sensor histidine kinase [Mobilicoccus pelagius]|uniref:Putative two-component histidine kinase n=1 Tax=Mobilicoccus pelagius NBRC 104925 TaxID=1089455 RepID=H5UQ41_9MICO|nr:GAF domain-containing sensor histidine kinase [Mobilicoccus pelagius]GAB47846.1 putative two-component histidine kinase [Mobilicoccus pelagius NBRC 104925]